MARYPGATFKPTSWGGKVQRNKQGRGILHVAVSAAKSLPPWDGNTWHLYVAKAAPDGSTDGSGGPAYCEQYVDTEYRAYGDVDANDDAIVIETAGGLGSSSVLNAEPWTRAQELRIADFMRWEAAQPDGAPLELLPDARPGRRGWGPHRLGIKHSGGARPGWWQPGSEVWSSILGKECPGDAKVRQIPTILALARGGTAEDFMATMSDQEKAALMEVVYTFLPGKSGRTAGPGWIRLDDSRNGIVRVEALVRAAAQGAGLTDEQIEQIVTGVADKLGEGFDLELQPKPGA